MLYVPGPPCLDCTLTALGCQDLEHPWSLRYSLQAAAISQRILPAPLYSCSTFLFLWQIQKLSGHRGPRSVLQAFSCSLQAPGSGSDPMPFHILIHIRAQGQPREEGDPGGTNGGSCLCTPRECLAAGCV